MPRPLRVEFEDAIYHLCTRGNARQAIDDACAAKIMRMEIRRRLGPLVMNHLRARAKMNTKIGENRRPSGS